MALVTADSNLVTADVIVVDASGYWPPDIVTVGAVTCTPELSTIAAHTLPNAFSTGMVSHTTERGVAARQAGPGMVRHQ